MADPNSARLEQISTWILQQMEQAQADGLVLQIDGTTSSAVLAALAGKAAGSRALGLILPCQSCRKTIEDATLVAEALNLNHELIHLDSAFDVLRNLLPAPTPRALHHLKTRLRMAALYYLANTRNCLVLGSSSRNQWETGDFTKFGSGAADIQPLIHLTERQIRSLAMALAVPEKILHKTAVPDPLEIETEPEEPGFSESQLEAFLSGETDTLPELVQFRVRETIARTDHKRTPPASLAQPTAAIPIDYDKGIEALTLISKAITSDQYVEDILRLIVMVTAEVMNSSVCSLWLLDEQDKVLRLRATQSINQAYLKERVLRLGEGVVGKVVLEDRPLAILDVHSDPFYKEKELAQQMGLVSMLSMPMRVKNRVIGVINCYTSHPHEFTELQVNILTTVANQAAVAIENTELLVRTKVIEEELATRKIIERAKDLILDRLQMSGEEAYRWLQKRSMDTRKSMREVAEAVLLTMGG